MRNMPSVTIVVTAYNIEQYIKECLESLLNQTYQNLQILVIDDGSTDGTGIICDAINSEKVIVWHKENEGLVAARKDGIRIATGDYIGFVDGDDLVDENFVEVLVDGIVASKADMIHSGYYELRDDIKTECGGVFNGLFRFESIDDRIDFIQKYVFSSNSDKWISSSIWSKLFKKELISKAYSVVPEEQSYGEDLLCLINSIMLCNKLAVIDKKAYGYRVRDLSMSHIRNDKLFFNEINLCKEIDALCQRFGEDRLNRYAYMFIRERQKRVWDETATYYLEDSDFFEKKRLLLYGAGRVGRDYFEQLKRKCSSLILVDRDFETIKDLEVISPEMIKCNSFDYAVIAVENKYVADVIKSELVAKGVSERVIIWTVPKKK